MRTKVDVYAWLIWIALALALVSGCKYRKVFSSPTITQLPPAQYVQQMESDSAFYLIDVRTSLEYSASHMDSAINISYVLGGFQRKVAELDTNRTVYLYCETAHRSPYATKALKKAGFTRIYDLKRGYRAYRKYQRRQARR